MKKLLSFLAFGAYFGLNYAQTPSEVETVDLGLPSGTLWANMNLGANSVTEYGNYFSWGETSIRDIEYFDQNSYPLYKETQSSYIDTDGFTVTETKKGYIKYVRESDASTYGYDGFYDNKYELETVDDAASVLWGDGWKLPTETQWEELSTECTWQTVTLNGINGFKVIGKNNKYIFLPKGGYCYNSYYRNYLGEYACYWSSTLSYTSEEACGYTNTGKPNSSVGGTRWAGRLIRAVSTTNLSPVEKEKCKKPVIKYENGKLLFTSETEGAEFVYSITDDDICTATTSDVVSLCLTYNVRAYAYKTGFDNSDIVTATLCWIDADPKTEGVESGVVQVKANAVLIHSYDGILSLVGVADGTDIAVYSSGGMMVGSSKVSGASTSIATGLRNGEIAIVRIGDKTVKVLMK